MCALDSFLKWDVFQFLAAFYDLGVLFKLCPNLVRVIFRAAGPLSDTYSLLIPSHVSTIQL